MKKFWTLLLIIVITISSSSCFGKTKDDVSSSDASVFNYEEQGSVSKDNVPLVIDENTIWFDTTINTVEDVGTVLSVFSTADNDSFVIESLNNVDFKREYIICSFFGEKLHSFTLGELSNGEEDYSRVEEAFFLNNSWHFIVMNGSDLWIVDIGGTGIIDRHKVEINFSDSKESIAAIKRTDNGFVVFTFMNKGSYMMGIYLLDDQMSVEKSMDSISINDYPEIMDVAKIQTDKFEVYLYTGEEYLVDFNEKTCSIQEDSDWRFGLGDYFSHNEEVYARYKNGVVRVDYDNQQLLEFFDYNSCFQNRDVLARSFLISADSEQIVMGYEQSDMTMFGSLGSDFEITILNKADNNPNVGKTVLTVATVTPDIMVPYYLSEAIMNFNMTNEDYLIILIEDYNLDNFTDDYIINLYDNVSATSVMSDKMIMDLLSGDGPDIIIGGFDISMLHDDEYLVDLTSLGEEILRDTNDSYFENVFEACKEDGAMYCIPLSFSVEAVFTNQWVKDSGKGFTFEEYNKFVSETMNGVDPLLVENKNNRMSCFAALFSCMEDEFIKDGKIDLDNEAFRQICNYIKGLPEYSYSEGGSVGTGCFFYGVEKYILLHNDLKGLGAYGYPSFDGRGPTLNIVDSLSITSNCKDVAAASEFIKMVLTPELQKEGVKKDSIIPVSKLAIEERFKEEIEVYNANRLYGEELDESIIQEYESLIETASGNNSSDPTIIMLICEELQPYLAGDKTLDEVIPIMEDRCQRVLDERG